MVGSKPVPMLIFPEAGMILTGILVVPSGVL